MSNSIAYRLTSERINSTIAFSVPTFISHLYSYLAKPNKGCKFYIFSYINQLLGKTCFLEVLHICECPKKIPKNTKKFLVFAISKCLKNRQILVGIQAYWAYCLSAYC